MRYVVGIDFDGVIHRYSMGDMGDDIYDIPTSGASESLRRYIQIFDVQIVSARAATSVGQEKIHQWMKKHDLPPLPCSDKKPGGELLVMIDDRAFEFRGVFPSTEELLNFKPWWKK